MNTHRVALITGANKGIGREVARQLGHKGITVLASARDLALGEETAARLRQDGADAHAFQLDVTDHASIEALPPLIEKQFGRLDILVNNAGIMLGHEQPPSHFPLASIREVFETNFFGVVAVTQAMLPLLRKSPCGRIVNLSSGLGSLTQLSDPRSRYYDVNLFAYNASKTALNAFTVSLAKELKGSHLKVNSADPDWVKTDMGGAHAPGTVEDGADTPVWLATLPEDGPTGGFFNHRKPIPW